MSVVDVGEGCAVLEMVVSDNHANGHGACQGSMIYSLAGSAFAFAGTSRNQLPISQHSSITYVAPARRGDRLTATAHEVSLKGCNGILDMAVTNQKSTKAGMFRGFSRTIQGQLFSEDAVV